MSSLHLYRPDPGIPVDTLLELRCRSPATREAYLVSVRQFIEWAGRRPLTALLFAEWIEDLRPRVSAAKLRQCLTGGRAAIMQAAATLGMSARELGALKATLDSIPSARPAQPKMRTVNSIERSMIVDVLPEKMATVFRFLYASAARVSEALGVRTEDIRIDGSYVDVRLRGKGNKERWTRIPLELLKEINTAFGGKRTWLFESAPGRRYSRQAITLAIRQASKAAIGRWISAHDLRHSRATDLYAKKHNLKGVSTFLGHADISTTAAFYVKSELTDEDLDEEDL